MIRGCLVSIIYDKTMQLPSTTAKGSAALTLMSSDVDRIALTAETAYEIWAGLLEIGIAIYLLERQIGWACIAPLLLAVGTYAINALCLGYHPADMGILKFLLPVTQPLANLYLAALSSGNRLFSHELH